MIIQRFRNNGFNSRIFYIFARILFVVLALICFSTILYTSVNHSPQKQKEPITNEIEYIETLPIIEESVSVVSEYESIKDSEVEVIEVVSYMKPKNLDSELFDVVIEECENLNIPVNFVLAVMKTETQDFNTSSVNHNSNGTHDSGIMQINSSNIESFAHRYNIPEFADNPYDPVANIRVGIRYLAEHYSTYLIQYERDVDKAILAASGAYNRGAYNQNKYQNIYDYNARVYKHYTNLENGLDVNVNYQSEIPAFKSELQGRVSLK